MVCNLFFWKLGMCCQVRFITRSVKCMVTMQWVMARLGNGFGRSVKDERMYTVRREVGIHLWWMVFWCIRSTKECVTKDVSQFLICPCTFLGFQGFYSMTLSVVIWVIGKCVHNGCPRCSQGSTKNSLLHVLWHFWCTITTKETTCWAILAPSDHHLFLHLKKFLGGKQFDDDDDLKDAAQKSLTTQVATFYKEGIQKLVPRYDKCLNNDGKYVER